MKRRFVSILCAATMVASLMTGATVVSAADKEIKEKKGEIKEQEERLLQRENNIDRRDTALQNRETALEERENNLLDKFDILNGKKTNKTR